MADILDFTKPHVLRNEEEYDMAVAEIDTLLDTDPQPGSEAKELNSNDPIRTLHRPLLLLLSHLRIQFHLALRRLIRAILNPLTLARLLHGLSLCHIYNPKMGDAAPFDTNKPQTPSHSPDDSRARAQSSP